MSWLDDEMRLQKRAASLALGQAGGQDSAPAKPPMIFHSGRAASARPRAVAADPIQTAMPATAQRTSPAITRGGAGMPAKIAAPPHPAAESKAALSPAGEPGSGSPPDRAAGDIPMGSAVRNVFEKRMPEAPPATRPRYDLQALSDALEWRALREARNLNVEEQGVIA